MAFNPYCLHFRAEKLRLREAEELAQSHPTGKGEWEGGLKLKRGPLQASECQQQPQHQQVGAGLPLEQAEAEYRHLVQLVITKHLSGHTTWGPAQPPQVAMALAECYPLIL